MSFTDIFIRRPVLSSVVSLLILLIGLSAAFNLQVRQYPELSNTTITVTTSYPGANADVIKGFITVPIQQAVASAEGIDTLSSTSLQSVSTVTLNLRLNADPDRAVADVLSKVNQVRSVLPPEAMDPVVVKQTGESTALMYLSFNSDVLTSSQITDYLTRVVQPKLQTVDGVANAQILGGQTFAMRIWLDPKRMAALGITPLQVRTALAANNFTTAAGQIKGDFVQTTINAQTSLDNAEAFGQLVVAARGDALVRLRDIADIALGAETVDSTSAFNGLKAVFIGIYSTPTANPLTVIADVRKTFPSIIAELPPGMTADIAYDSTKFIDASITEVQKDAARSSGDRDHRHLPVSRQPALYSHSDHYHPAVADRRDVRAAGAWLLAQPAHSPGAGAGHRPRRRRRHRRRREHPPPHRGGAQPARRGPCRRTRDRRAGHLDDHYAGRGLCADRLRLRLDRLAVPRVRLHAGRRGDRLGNHRTHPVADDVLEALER